MLTAVFNLGHHSNHRLISVSGEIDEAHADVHYADRLSKTEHQQLLHRPGVVADQRRHDLWFLDNDAHREPSLKIDPTFAAGACDPCHNPQSRGRERHRGQLDFGHSDRDGVLVIAEIDDRRRVPPGLELVEVEPHFLERVLGDDTAPKRALDRQSRNAFEIRMTRSQALNVEKCEGCACASSAMNDLRGAALREPNSIAPAVLGVTASVQNQPSISSEMASASNGSLPQSFRSGVLGSHHRPSSVK